MSLVQHVRLEGSGVTHAVTSPFMETSDYTACGVTFILIGLPLFYPIGLVTDDPIDCMACIALGGAS